MKEINRYYEDKTSDKGLIALSDKVFTQIAENVLKQGLEDNKGTFALENGKKKGYIKTRIGKNNFVRVEIGIFLPIGEDTSLLGEIQKAVYDEELEATELASLKVDFVLLGCYKA